MKRSILLLAFALLTINNMYSQYIVSGSTYKPLSFEEKIQPFLMYQQAYEKFESQVLSLENHIAECLQNDTIDKTMRTILTNLHKRTINLYKQLSNNGLSQSLRKEYSDIYTTLRIEITNYNNRIRE